MHDFWAKKNAAVQECVPTLWQKRFFGVSQVLFRFLFLFFFVFVFLFLFCALWPYKHLGMKERQKVKKLRVKKNWVTFCILLPFSWKQKLVEIASCPEIMFHVSWGVGCPQTDSQLDGLTSMQATPSRGSMTKKTNVVLLLSRQIKSQEYEQARTKW